MLYPSSHPFQRSQLVNPSAPFPSLNQESKHLYHSLSPSSRFSSFLFLHCFHMLPYPLNLTQLGRVELSSPDTRRTTYNSIPQHISCQACVFTVPQFDSWCQYSKGGPTFRCLWTKSDIQMLQAYLEKSCAEKKAMEENLIITALFAISIPAFFIFFLTFIYSILLFFHSLITCFFHIKPFISQWSRFSTGITSSQLSGAVTVYISWLTGDSFTKAVFKTINKCSEI